MEKDILGRRVKIRFSEGDGKWEVWADLYEEAAKADNDENAVERDFYGIGEDREDAEEMMEILITNYLKKKWKKERLQGQDG